MVFGFFYWAKLSTLKYFNFYVSHFLIDKKYFRLN